MGVKEDAYELRTLKDCICQSMCEGNGCENCILPSLTRENWGRLKFSDLMETPKMREARKKRGHQIVYV